MIIVVLGLGLIVFAGFIGGVRQTVASDRRRNAGWAALRSVDAPRVWVDEDGETAAWEPGATSDTVPEPRPAPRALSPVVQPRQVETPDPPSNIPPVGERIRVPTDTGNPAHARPGTVTSTTRIPGATRLHLAMDDGEDGHVDILDGHPRRAPEADIDIAPGGFLPSAGYAIAHMAGGSLGLDRSATPPPSGIAGFTVPVGAQG